jgi:hypothetical protein
MTVPFVILKVGVRKELRCTASDLLGIKVYKFGWPWVAAR